ncbi:hypothetical protein [Caldimonas tepidiphila]|uniref:hypothetical protein n=1 Tax=Caldimonas tepidiphila TaxID=2315841 RepID=UPI000E5C4569|nr:hypothetical protein [Caldimonas tepidiphila]
MEHTYTAFVNCRKDGSTKPFQPRMVTFSLPVQEKRNPLDIELTAFREARRQGFEVLHVVSFRQQEHA